MQNDINADLRLKQEMVNSLLHALGILFGIVCIPILLTQAVKNDNVPGIIGSGIYGFSFLMVFTASTLYHGFQQQKIKQLMKILDHISIYFLIAGTYTPFILNFLFNKTGILMLCILWGLSFAGIFFKIYFVNRFNILSTIIYLLMGWLLLWFSKAFFAPMPSSVIVLIAIGAVLYSIGVIFYLWQKWVWHHAIWHLLVLSAAVCHYVAVLLTVA